MALGSPSHPIHTLPLRVGPSIQKGEGEGGRVVRGRRCGGWVERGRWEDGLQECACLGMIDAPSWDDFRRWSIPTHLKEASRSFHQQIWYDPELSPRRPHRELMRPPHRYC